MLLSSPAKTNIYFINMYIMYEIRQHQNYISKIFSVIDVETANKKKKKERK